jgi:formate hydrogenlyase transcriptional activator
MANIPAQERSDSRQYKTLLEVLKAVAAHRDLSALFRDLAPRLHRLIPFDYINVVLHDPATNRMHVHVLEPPLQGDLRPGWELPVEQSPGGWVWQHQQALAVPDIEQETRFPEVTSRLRQNGMKSFYLFPLTAAGQRLGALGFGCRRESAYRQGELESLQEMAKLVAVVVDNALNFERAEAAQQQLTRERDHLRLLLEVNNAVVSTLDLGELLRAISTSLRRVVAHDYASLAIYHPESAQLCLHALDFSEGKGLSGRHPGPDERHARWSRLLFAPASSDQSSGR